MIETRTVKGVEQYRASDGHWYPVLDPNRKRQPREGESADSGRTRRSKALIARGIHPCTKLPFLEPRYCEMAVKRLAQGSLFC
jgi:hypothetical protein